MDKSIIRYPIDDFVSYSKLVKDIPDFFSKLEKKVYKIDKIKVQNGFIDKLNKLNAENFTKVSLEIQEIEISDEKTMIELVNTIFNKAIIEKIYIPIYIKLCLSLIQYYIIDKNENKKVYFREKLINTVQNAFNHVIQGNKNNKVIIFIGELYNYGIFNGKIINTCLTTLINKMMYDMIGDLFKVVKTNLKKNNNEVYKTIKKKINEMIKDDNIDVMDKLFLKNSLEDIL